MRAHALMVRGRVLGHVLVAVGLLGGCGSVSSGDPDGASGDDGAGSDARLGASDGGGADASDGPPNVAFITSTSLPSGAVGSLAEADAFCASSAAAASLPGTYVAWLSSSTVDARDRLGAARGWVLADGRPFTDRVEDLVAGMVFYPLSIDETGAPVTADTFVMTGTFATGTANDNATCDDFTDVASVFWYGEVMGGSVAWTSTAAVSCNARPRLYCFGTDRVAQVEPTRSTGPRAFISAAGWTPAGRITAADAVCQLEAANAGLTGIFRALLATSTTSAAERFDLAAPSWVRTDGVRLAASRADLMAGLLETPIMTEADGTYSSAARVWTGAPGTALVGAADRTCADWTASGSELGNEGIPGMASRDFFSQGAYASCSNGGRHLLCLEGP